MGGGNNSETYWFSGSNNYIITKAKSIHARRPNDFRITSIISKNCIEGIPDKKKLPLEESESKITITSWVAWIMSYM